MILRTPRKVCTETSNHPCKISFIDIIHRSDAPIDTLLHPIKHWVQQIRNLTEKAPAGIRFTQGEVDAILGGNAARVLGLVK